MKLTSFTHICREIKNVPIYALYLESFCVKNLATRKVFAFSDSGKNLPAGQNLTKSSREMVAVPGDLK